MTTLSLRFRQLFQRLERKSELLRGRWLVFLGATAGIRFGVGSGVAVKFPELLVVGNDVMIEGPGFLHCLSRNGVKIGDNTILARNVHLHCGGTNDDFAHGYFTIGRNCYIGPNAVLGASGGITIGSNVLFGPNVTVSSENHVFQSSGELIRNQGLERKGVVIEDDSWVSSGAIILDGVTLEKGTVVAAGAVVTRSTPAFSVVAGVPARLIKRRRDQYL